MKRITLCCFTVLMVSSIGISQVQLQVFSKITNPDKFYTSSYIQETNLRLGLRPITKMPANGKGLSATPWLIGIALDLSFPHYGQNWNIKTGYSAHVSAGYLISSAFLIASKIGYIKFGSNIQEDIFQTYEHEQTNIPLSIGVNYLFETGKAFKPFIGLSLGLIIQNYYSKITSKVYTDVNEYSSTETSLGLITELGLYYMVASKTMIQLSVAHSLVFNKLDLDGYLSIFAGVTFTLGGN